MKKTAILFVLLALTLTLAVFFAACTETPEVPETESTAAETTTSATDAETDPVTDTETEPAVSETESTTEESVFDPTTLPKNNNQCADALWINGEEVHRSVEGDLTTDYVRGTLNGVVEDTDGTITSIMLEGWVVAGGGYTDIGYYINGELVSNAEWLVLDEELCNQLGPHARRYFIEIDTSDLAAGTYQILPVVQYKNDGGWRYIDLWGVLTLDKQA